MKDANAYNSPPAYQVHGADPALPLLLYVAGMDGTGELFYKQIPALLPSYRVITYRLRDRRDATYQDLTDDLAAVIRDTGAAKVTMVGESFGGSIALAFALGYPQMLERLVLVNSFPYYRGRFRINLAAGLAAVVPHRVEVPFRLMMTSIGLWLEGVTGEDRRRVLRALCTVDMESYARRLRLIAEVNLKDRLAEIHTPTLLVATTRDLLVSSVREAQFMAARLPNASVKVMAGAGHACLLGDRVQLAELIRQWLAC